MRSYSELPEDYTEILQIDLQKNKRLHFQQFPKKH